MSYIMLANKFRPKTFDEIIGQDYICQILKNAIKEKRIANAYLFSGNRGCGKTSMARIFAKALNCQNGPTVSPCGVCYNCTSITNGNNIDVLEIDGASNNGIDEIRALIENTKFANANSCYKIYIIDEAHQITTQAFNALLKTIEEPPRNVIFILATTAQNKIPITILSRCQIYQFRLISPLKLNNEIKRIACKEGLKVTSEAIDIITLYSNGSMRDALNILDQIVNVNSRHDINGDDIRQLLGFTSKNIMVSMINYIANNNINQILHLVTDIYNHGYNIIQFAKDLKNYLRMLMFYSIDPQLVQINDEEKIIIEKQQIFFSVSRYVRISNLLSRAIQEMRTNDEHSNVILEMYLIKSAEPYYNINELIDKIDKLIILDKTSAVSHTYNLISIWGEIVDELIKKYPLTAQALRNISIETINSYTVQLSANTKFDYDTIIDFENLILKLLKEKTNNLNIKIKINSNINKVYVENEIFKNNSNTNKTPKYILDIAKKFKSKAIKIFNK